MNSTVNDLEFEIDYDVSYRQTDSPRPTHNVSAKGRFQTQVRYARGGKGSVVNGAHRRRDKRNHV